MRPLDSPFFPRQRKSNGFSLVELAVVLAVLGLLAGTLITPLAARIDASRRHAADAMLDDVEHALVGFALLHRRLPCPDAGDGVEHPPPCAFPADSRLPWRTLALPETDPWGEPWRYRPDKKFTDGSITLDTSPGSNLQIEDHAHGSLTTSESRVVAVVYSIGPNRRADGRNAETSTTFEGGEPTPGYDDRLRWLGHPFLIGRMAQAGRL
ncbi:MAG: type II secretion system GspH family protein [Azoarcus sp.]|jgi:prepilin-type N-terminal cleavage/methylation domain-containing protein|nr:type II secretion system GspH family protein [Azoarcus sp.]